jgi:hypothetical protein
VQVNYDGNNVLQSVSDVHSLIGTKVSHEYMAYQPAVNDQARHLPPLRLIL